MTSIVIPASVATIDPAFFQQFPGTTAVRVAADNSNYSTYNGMLFNKEQTDLLLVPEGMEGAAVLPSSLAAVPACVFSRSYKLSAIEVPTGSTASARFNTWNGLLYNADKTQLLAAPAGLTSATLAAECSTIGEGAFAGNADLKTIVVNGNVDQIHEAAFAEVALAATVAMAGDFNEDAWRTAGFTNFKHAAQPGAQVQPDATSGLTFTLLDDYTLAASWQGDSPAPEKLQIPATVDVDGAPVRVSAIADRGFADQPNLREVELPGSLTALGEGAFEGAGLISVNVPGSVRTISTRAFAGCGDLASVALNEGTAVIGAGAFAGIAIEKITLPASIATVAEGAFEGCQNLGQVLALGNVTEASPTALAETSGVNIYVPLQADEAYAFTPGAPAQGNHLMPYGISASEEPIELTVGEEANLDEGTTLEAPGAIEVTTSYKSNVSVTEGRTLVAKQLGTTPVTTTLSLDGDVIDQAVQTASVSRAYDEQYHESSAIEFVAKGDFTGVNGYIKDGYPLLTITTEDWEDGSAYNGYVHYSVRKNSSTSYTLAISLYSYNESEINTPSKPGYSFTGWKFNGKSFDPETFNYEEFDFTNSDVVSGSGDDVYNGKTTRFAVTPTWKAVNETKSFTDEPEFIVEDVGSGTSGVSNGDYFTYWAESDEDEPVRYTVDKNGTSNKLTVTQYYDSGWSNGTSWDLVPTRPGYIFNGWQLAGSGGSWTESSGANGFSFSDSDVVGSYTSYDVMNGTTCSFRIKPIWKVDPTGQKYTVTFNDNGGSGGPGSLQVEYNKSYDPLTTKIPTRSGYKFKGYYDSTASNAKLIFMYMEECPMTSTPHLEGIWTKAGAGTVYAHWEPITYTVTFNSQGGSSVASKTVNHGSTLSKPTDPTKTGYDFGGWYRESSCTNAWNFTSNTVTSNMTLYAKWTGKQYTVTFNDNGGSGGPGSITVEYGRFYDPLSTKIPTRAGYTFKGYYDGSTLVAPYFPNGCPGTSGAHLEMTWTKLSNGTVTAKWEPATANYYVRHYQQNTAQNGYNLALTETKSGTTESTGTATARSYTGFTYNASKSTTSGTIAGDGSLYLSLYYDRNTYTIKYNLNGGTGSTSDTYIYGVAKTLQTPSRTGYAFDGWCTDAALSSSPTKTLASGATGNKEFWAKWTTNTYPVSVSMKSGHGGSAAANPTQVAHGSSTTITYTPAEGWDFDYANTTVSGGTKGAQSGNSFTVTNVTGNVTVQVAAKKKSYNVTAKFVDESGNAVSGGSLSGTGNKEHGTSATITASYPTGYEYKSHTPSGFSANTGKTQFTLSSVTAAAELRIVVQKKTYTVRFNANGGTPAPAAQNIKHGEKVIAPSVTKTGATLEGWYKEASLTNKWDFNTAVTGAMTLYAKWTTNTYPVSVSMKSGHGGSAAANPTQVAHGSSTTITYTPAEGWDFDYANTTVSGGTKGAQSGNSFTVTNVTGNVTVQVAAKKKSYTVTFVANGGTPEPNSQVIAHGQVVRKPDISKTGYTLEGWYRDEALTQAWDFTWALTGNVKLYAKWVPSTDTPYVVKEFLQNTSLDSYREYKYGERSLTGTTGETVTAAPTPYVHYTYNTSLSTASGVVAADGSLVLSLYYDLKHYSITYHLNGGSGPESDSYVHGEEKTLPIPTREGYTFGGWYTDEAFTSAPVTKISTTDADAKEFWAKWTVNAFNVTGKFVDESGTVVSGGSFSNTGSHEQGSSLWVNIKLPTGYEYVKRTVTGSSVEVWVVSENEYNYTIANLDADTDITITVRKKSYGITAKLVDASGNELTGGAVALSAQTVIHGTGSVTATVTYPAGYEYASYDKANCTVTKNSDTKFTITNATGAVTLTIKAKLKKYQVSFDADGGSPVPQTQTIEHGKAVSAPTGVAKEGYDLDGWYNGNTKWDFSAGVTGPLTLKAKWAPKGDTPYKVEHYKQDVTGIGYTLAETENLTGATGSEKTGTFKTYTGFVSNEAKSATTKTGTIAGNGTTVLKLYYDRMNLTVTFHSNGGSAVDSQTVRYEGVANRPNDPTREGYDFKGWFADEALTKEFAFDTQLTSNIDLYAKWDGKVGTSYRVQHFQQQLNGTYTVTDTDQSTGKTGSLATATAKSYEGFHENTTHSDRKPTGTIAADGGLVLKLYYDRDMVTVTFDVNGGKPLAESVKTQKVMYGAKLANVLAERDGYTLDGWYNGQAKWDFAANTVPAVEGGKLTLTAKWTPKTYDIVLHVDGSKTISGGTHTYGIETTLPGMADMAEHAPQGKKFAGWHVDSALTGSSVAKVPAQTMGDAQGKIHYYAKWADKAIAYTVTHHKEKLGGGYDEEVEELAASQAGTVSANPKYFKGFAFDEDHEQNLLECEISEGGQNKLHVYYERNTLLVTFITGASVGTTYETVKYEGTVKAPVVQRDGYTLVGWVTATGADWNASTPVTENLTLNAVWEPTKVTVVWDANGGSFGDSASKAVEYGYGDAFAELTEAPLREGHVFLGWAASADSADQVIWPSTVTKPATYYAIWGEEGPEAVYATYTVKAICGEAVLTERTANAKVGAVLTVAAPVVAGYQLAEGQLESTSLTMTADAAMNVVVFEYTPLQTAVGFDAQGGTGTGYEGLAFTYGSQIPAELEGAAPSRTGYTLAGWYSQQQGGGTMYYNGQGERVFSDMWNGTATSMMLYAHWIPITFTVKYRATADAADSATDAVTYGDAAAVLREGPTAAGLTIPENSVFGGWLIDGTAYAAGAPAGRLATEQDAQVIAVPKWINTGGQDPTQVRMVVWKANGGVFATGVTEISQAFGPDDEVIDPAEPIRAGYLFEGWLEETSTDDSTIVKKAQWAQPWFKVAFAAGAEGAVTGSNVAVGDPGKVANTPFVEKAGDTTVYQWFHYGDVAAKQQLPMVDGLFSVSGMSADGMWYAATASSWKGGTVLADDTAFKALLVGGAGDNYVGINLHASFTSRLAIDVPGDVALKVSVAGGDVQVQSVKAKLTSTSAADISVLKVTELDAESGQATRGAMLANARSIFGDPDFSQVDVLLSEVDATENSAAFRFNLAARASEGADPIVVPGFSEKQVAFGLDLNSLDVGRIADTEGSALQVARLSYTVSLANRQ